MIKKIITFKNSLLSEYLVFSCCIIFSAFIAKQFLPFDFSAFIFSYIFGVADLAVIIFFVKSFILRKKNISLFLSIALILFKNFVLIALLYQLTQYYYDRVSLLFIGFTLSVLQLIIIGIRHSGAEHATRNVMV